MYDDNVALQGPLPYSSPCILHNRHRFCGVGLGASGMDGGSCRVIDCVCVCTKESIVSLAAEACTHGEVEQEATLRLLFAGSGLEVQPRSSKASLEKDGGRQRTTAALSIPSARFCAVAFHERSERAEYLTL